MRFKQIFLMDKSQKHAILSSWYDSTEYQAKLIYGGKILYQWLPWDSVRD